MRPRRSAAALPDFIRRPGLIAYGFFFGWADVCFGCSGVGVGLCSRTIFPSQEMYAPMISSRSFFRLNSISAILCSKVLCSSGICSFLSELPYCREVDSFSRRPSGSAQTADASFQFFRFGVSSVHAFVFLWLSRSSMDASGSTPHSLRVFE